MDPRQSPAESTARVVVPGRQRLRFQQWPLAAVLVGVAVGLGVAVVIDFRPGSLVVGGVGMVAAVLRLVLPARRAGLLVVRSRAVDVMVLLALSAAIVVLAIVVPPPPA